MSFDQPPKPTGVPKKKKGNDRPVESDALTMGERVRDNPHLPWTDNQKRKAGLL